MGTWSRRQFVQHVGATLATAGALRISAGSAAERSSEPLAPAEKSFTLPQNERQLFLDDADVAQRENLRRTLHRPEKKGAVIRTDRAVGGYPETRCAPAWDPDAKVWKLWTVCVTPEELHGTGGLSGYHESTDGVNWSAPRLRRVEYKGSRENNFVFIPMGEGRTGEIFCAVYDGTESDRARHYKGFSFLYRPPSIVFAVSPDGIEWTRLDTPPIASQDETNLSFDAGRRLFLATVKVSGPFGRAHALTTSADFVKWTEPKLVFNADARDQAMARDVIVRHLTDPALQQPVFHHPEVYATDVYNFAISRYESRYLGFASFFYHVGHAWNGTNHDGFHQVQLAVSHDAKNWERVADRQPFLVPSPLGAGAYDTMQIIGPSTAIVRDDELWFYYTGIRHRYPPPNASWDNSAICLATLRRDGFVSLDSDDREGTLTTRPFRCAASRLHVNADAAGGQITCEVLDAAGMPLPGFSRGESLPITTDTPKSAVAWKQEDRLPDSADRPLRLRFFLRKSRLFSYWVEA